MFGWIDIFTEEIFHHAHANHRLGFLPRDAVRLTSPPFEARGNVLLHHLRRHAGIKSDDLDRRRFERWQNVRRQFRDRRESDDQNRQREHDDGVRIFQRGFNHRTLFK